MNRSLLNLLCDPGTQESLQWKLADDDEWRPSEYLANESGKRYPIKHGIPLFAGQDPSLGDLLRLGLATSRDTVQRVVERFWGRHDEMGLLDALLQLDLTPRHKVLELLGPSGPHRHMIPEEVSYVGVGPSWNRLLQCQDCLRRRHDEPELLQAREDRLPFKADTFDLVMRLDMLPFFEQPKVVMGEMLRAARPCATVLLAFRLGGRVFDRTVATPSMVLDLVPEGAQEVSIQTPKGTGLFLLSFSKPNTVRTCKPIPAEPIQVATI